jgi:hypothetical protein
VQWALQQCKKPIGEVSVEANSEDKIAEPETRGFSTRIDGGNKLSNATNAVFLVNRNHRLSLLFSESVIKRRTVYKCKQ